MIELLKKLTATPSFSGDEADTARIIYDYLLERGVKPSRYLNNVTATSSNYRVDKPTLLLNSHHDTVRPSSGYTRNPFEPSEEDGRLYGLGSNDAGASTVALISVFCKLYDKDLPYNIVLAITGEEESIGKNGIAALWPELPSIDFAIVGEPTGMNPARAERGLIVLDCLAEGVSGHAARNEGVNAIYKALDDIEIIRNLKFDRVSDLSGEVKLTVTQINAGIGHNVIPSECGFVVDIRPNDLYDNKEIVETIKRKVNCKVTPRSLHLRASGVPADHILMKTAESLGMESYVSPTTSDISRINVPALKLGPGDSARSHTADEYVYIDEVVQGEKIYTEFLNRLSEFI